MLDSLLDSSGTSSRPNGVGVVIVNGSDNLIQENVIAGNTKGISSILSLYEQDELTSKWVGGIKYKMNVGWVEA